MKPIAADKLTRLESILARIWSGELVHSQHAWQCDTSACVGGWYALIYGNAKPFIDPELIESLEIRTAERTRMSPLEMRGFVKEDLGLTEPEAELLFSADTGKSLHREILNAFKQGRRLSLDEHFKEEDIKRIRKGEGKYLDIRPPINECAHPREYGGETEVSIEICLENQNYSDATRDLGAFFSGAANWTEFEDSQVFRFPGEAK